MPEPLGRQSWYADDIYRVPVGMLARASGGYDRAASEFGGDPYRDQRRFFQRRRVSPLAAIRQVSSALSSWLPPSYSGKKEPLRGRRGRRGTSNYSRALAGGPNAQFEEAIPKAKGTPRVDSSRTVALRLRGANPFGVASGGVLGAGNQLVTLYTDLWFRQRAIRERRGNILAVGRRGADATRRFQPSGYGLTNRSGALSTRAAAAPSASAAPKPASRPADLRQPVSAPSPLPAPAARPSPVAQPAPALARATARAPMVAVNWDPMRMLASALAPAANYAQAALSRAGAVVRTAFRTNAVNALPTTIRRPGTSPLTSLNPGLVASTLTQPQPLPQADPCAKQQQRKKRDEKQRCRNPVISRTTRDGIRTTKVRLLCQPSKPK